jgi:hypothetical protein
MRFRSATAAAPTDDRRTTAADRRTRGRLRELCDEVIASHRVATASDPIGDDARREAQALLEKIQPRLAPPAR